MSKVKVSVIVPVYNVEEYLEKCLNSLIKQDFDNYEIIIVNDGSPDNSQKIIEKYEKKYPNKIKGYKKKNGGVSSARNYGLEKANGEYLVFVDSDDYVSTGYISSLYNKAIKNDYDIVICDMYEKSETYEKIILGIENKGTNILNNSIISQPAAWNKLYKKSLFLNNNIKYPEKVYYAEDLSTTPRLLVSAKKIGYIHKPLYYYVQRISSIMHQLKYNKKNADIFISLNILEEYLKNNNYYEKYKEELEYLYIKHLLHDYVLRIYQFEEGKKDIMKATQFMKKNYKKWHKNKYYKKESIKYKIVCNLIYYRQINILKLILK